MRATWIFAVAIAACGYDVGEPGVWVPIDDLQPPLTAESAALPGNARAATASDALRVVSFNVERGADPDRIAAAIQGNPAIAGAGLFLLQEEETHPGEVASRTSRLAEALGLAYSYVPARTYGDGTHGLALLSAYPLREVQSMILPDTGVGSSRIAVTAEVLVGDAVIPVIDVHLATKINITDRILELRPAVIDAPPAVIVAGDFNTNPYLWAEGEVPLLPTGTIVDTDQAPLLDDYMRAIGFSTPTADLGATEHMYGIESRLDSIYVRGFETRPGAVERSIAVSDHWPLWVDVVLPRP